MSRNTLWAAVTRAAAAAAAALLAVGVAACTSTSGAAGGGPSASASAFATGPAVPGRTARVALPTATRLTWIWPYTPPGKESGSNVAGFQMLMYRPLYMFGGDGPSVAVDYSLSVANPPVYSNGGRTVTITLKGWKWNDGETVDARDVIFWLNMMKAEPRGYYGYQPGQLPDNLASYRATGPETVVLQLKSPVSNIWFTYNQLAEITPMPAAWDVTAPGARAGSGGCATDSAADNWARCTAVFGFLTAQAEQTESYASSPVWSVVDGPWKLATFRGAGSGPVTSLVPNPGYSGSQKPELARFTYIAYPSDAAEYAALRSGQLDVGYVPPSDAAALTAGQALPTASHLGGGFTLSPVYQYGIQYVALNFNSPALGSAYRQLYVRQALQELIDQGTIIGSVDHGYGYPTSGSVPSQPVNPWISAVQNDNFGQGPYPFSVANATTLLTDHGWKDVGGVAICESPGTGQNQCGAGVTARTKLSMTLDYAAGSPGFASEAAIIKDDMAQAGIKLTLVPRSPGRIAGESTRCERGPACTWDLLYSGGWSFIGSGFEPSGQPLFATGAPANAGSYSDPEMDRLIRLTHTSGSLNVFQDYAMYAANHLPVVWLPNAYKVGAVSAKLANVGSNPLGRLLPEYWYFTR